MDETLRYVQGDRGVAWVLRDEISHYVRNDINSLMC